MGPKKGVTKLENKQDSAKTRFDNKDKEKRRFNVEKAISMTSSKLPYDSMANGSVKVGQ